MSVPLTAAVSVRPTSPTEVLRRFVLASRSAPAAPFRSLEPFGFADAGILAARDREIERLVRLITMYRGVLLYGESGVGKSSVVNAGVLPRMIEEGFWPHRVRVQPRSGEEFVLEPISCSDQGDDAFLPSAFAGAAADGRLVISAEHFAVAVASATDRGPILLVFDQFEELVTLFPRTAELLATQATIVDAIVSLLRGGAIQGPGDPPPMVPVKLQFSFREDHLAGLKPLLDAQPELVHQGLRLVPPPQSQATQIIRAPFERFPGHYRRELSSELAERIAASLGRRSEGRDTPLSELQIVCSRLWAADDPAALLDRLDVKGLLEEHLEDALRQFPGDLREAAVAVLGQLITSSNTRNVVARLDLVTRATDEQEGLDPALLEKAIGLLETESGLIRRERRHDVDLYELTSEFLIPWISRQRDQLSAVRARRLQERRLHRQMWVTAVIGVVLAIFVVLAVLFFHQRNTARHQKAVAIASQAVATDLDLASTAQSLLTIRPDVSLVLALAAYRGRPDLPEVKTSMLSALEEANRSGAFGILHGFNNTVTAVAFDPKKDLLASASADGTIRLWNTQSQRPAGELPYPERGKPSDRMFSLAFSPDGSTLVAGGQDGMVRLWSVASRGLLWRGSAHQGSVVNVAFSPNGRELAAAGLDEGIELFNLANSKPVGPLLGFGGSKSVRSVAFSPDSRTLASVGNHGIIQLWDVATRRPDGERFNARSALYTVAFKPHSNELAAGGLNGKIYLWELDRPRPTATLGDGNGAAVESVAFSPHGPMLAAGSANDSIQLWNVNLHRASGAPLSGQEGIVTSVAFSRNGLTLAAGSTDRTIRIWRIPAPSEFGVPLELNLGRVNSVAFGHHGKFAAAGGAGIRLWDLPANGPPSGSGNGLSGSHGVRSVSFNPVSGMLASGQGRTVQRWNAGEPTGNPVKNSGALVYCVAFSPDGRWLAFAGQRGAITLWNLTTGRRRKLSPQSGAYSIAFSPNSRILASGGEDRTIRLWNVSDGEPIGQLTGDSDAVFSVAFGSDTILASGSADDTIRLWNIATGREIGQPFIGNHGWVRSVAFNPPGNILASGSKDGAIRLWDVASAAHSAAHSAAQIGEPLSANTGGIESVAFSPDGKHLVSGGDDGAVRIWSVVFLPRHYTELRSMVCSRVWTGLDKTEWKDYAPGVPYENPCP